MSGYTDFITDGSTLAGLANVFSGTMIYKYIILLRDQHAYGHGTSHYVSNKPQVPCSGSQGTLLPSRISASIL